MKNCVCGLQCYFYICVLKQVGYFVYCWAMETEFGPCFGLRWSYSSVCGLVCVCVVLVFFLIIV
jgi:hypothetical protein